MAPVSKRTARKERKPTAASSAAITTCLKSVYHCRLPMNFEEPSLFMRTSTPWTLSHSRLLVSRTYEEDAQRTKEVVTAHRAH